MKINITRPFLPGINEVVPEFSECLSSGMVTNNSKYVNKFESLLQEYLQSKIKPICFTNGELALFHLIQAWKIKLGYDVFDSFDVLVPSFTFSGTINAIVMNNLRPIFCDIDDTLTLDISKVAPVGRNVKMIIAVSVYGNLPEIERIGRWAKDNGLVFILDNAPGFGATDAGKQPNHFGYSEIYSFHATKIFNSMEGGAAVVNDLEVADCLQKLRDFGQYEKARGDVDVPGLNAKMPEISAIVGMKNLGKIDQILTHRSRQINAFKDFFQRLERAGHVKNMRVRENVFCPYLYYPIILNEEATKFVNYLHQHDIACRRYYTAVHDLKLYRNRFACCQGRICTCGRGQREATGLDFTNAIKNRIVALPIHTEMSQDEMDYIFSTCNNFFCKA